MANNEKNKKDKKDEDGNEFYEEISEAADFVNDRLDDFIAPTALNNTVEEYVEEDEGKE